MSSEQPPSDRCHLFPFSFADEASREKAIELKRKWPGRLFDFVDMYARTHPKEISFYEYNTEVAVTWADFRKGSVAFAAKLLSYGIGKGDVISTQLPNLKEHIFLIFGALRVGAIVAPLDLRLKADEISRCFDLVKPKMFFHLGETPVIDFRTIVAEVIPRHSEAAGGTVKLFVQFQKGEDGIVDGAISVSQFAKRIAVNYVVNAVKECCCFCDWGVAGHSKEIAGSDIAFLIFTTGSTGFPKPASLTHESVICNGICTKLGSFDPPRQFPEERLNVVCALPLSHVGGLTALLATSVMSRDVLVVVHVFKPELVIDAIQKYNVHILGGIPAIFNLIWNLENYEDFDHSSLRFVVYSGQSVSEEFLKQMFIMAPYGGTGLGCTEVAGLATCQHGGTVEVLQESLGHASPFCDLSVRRPKNEDDGSAGEEIPNGEIGEICYRGPQVFAGYYGMPEVTAATMSTDGYLYTGDVGSLDERGVHFASRRKFVMKPKGYQVFPGEVEDFIQTNFPQIKFVATVGIEHRIYSQGIVAVIKLKNKQEQEQEQESEGEGGSGSGHPIGSGGGGMNVVVSDVDDDEALMLIKQIKAKFEEKASYKRPAHYHVLGPDEEFPLNRTKKTDYLACTKIAQEAVDELRTRGLWDSKN